VTRRRLSSAILLAAILGGAMPAAGATWDIRWQVSERPGREPRVQGYVTNQHLKTTTNLHVRVDRLAPDGRVVGTSRTVLGGPLWPSDRLYFDVRVPEHAPAYRVSVEAFDWFRCGD
jgi:hypothetical protein